MTIANILVEIPLGFKYCCPKSGFKQPYQTPSVSVHVNSKTSLLCVTLMPPIHIIQLSFCDVAHIFLIKIKMWELHQYPNISIILSWVLLHNSQEKIVTERRHALCRKTLYTNNFLCVQVLFNLFYFKSFQQLTFFCW